MLKNLSKPLTEGMHTGTLIKFTVKDAKGNETEVYYINDEKNEEFHVCYQVDGCSYRVTLKGKVAEGKSMSQLDVWQQNLITYYWEPHPFKTLETIIDKQITLRLEKKGMYPLDLKPKNYTPKPEDDTAPIIKKRRA